MIGQNAPRSNLDLVLRHDRFIVMAGLCVVVVLSAAYTISGAGMNMSAVTMTSMAIISPDMVMPSEHWSLNYGLLVFAMWSVMMVAMMLPTAAPMLLVHSAISRKRAASRRPFIPTLLFAGGYLAVWTGFSAVATVVQWQLHKIGVLTGMMQIASPLMSGLILVGAGLYQLTRLKQTCVVSCQHPVGFIMRYWRSGDGGAFQMGLVHGVLCLGCCWFLMALLFVGGVMNLFWIAGLAIYVGLEKFSARLKWLPRIVGIFLVSSGLLVLSQPLWRG